MTFSDTYIETYTRKTLLSYQKIKETCALKMILAETLKIENPLIKIKSATYNTDNKSNLFVTIFAVTPAAKKITLSLVPGYPQCSLEKSESKENDESTSILRPTLLYWLRLKSCTVSQKWFHVTLYRDYASFDANLYLEGKNCAMLRSLQLL